MAVGLKHESKNTPGPKDVEENGVIIEENYRDNEIKKFRFECSKLISFIGPGFLMSIAYLDPGNIAGDLEAGTHGGYQLIWTLMWATILGWFYQTLSARIGVTTQSNLAKLCAEQYSKHMRYILWIMTEVAIIASDI